MIGESVGPYRVVEMVGVGGMGTVWRASDEFLDRDVALKVVRPELLARPGLADRFRAEAIVLARLQHPNIAALYGVERRGEEVVMVMEFVDGSPLDRWLDRHGPFAWSDASRIVRNVLDGLEHAHERGVIHRDIKPANVMLTRAGRVKVMDFGIARLVGGQRLTSTGAAVGTPSYMSPEQLLGQEIDGRSDVYAVGTLLFELATGHVPFELPGDYMRMIAQLQQEPPPPSSHVATLPAALDSIVLKALAKEPGDRWESAGAMRDALEALEREQGVWRNAVTPIVPMSTLDRGASSTPLGTRTVPPATSDPGASAPAVPPFAAPAAVLTPADATPLPGMPTPSRPLSPVPVGATMAAAPIPVATPVVTEPVGALSGEGFGTHTPPSTKAVVGAAAAPAPKGKGGLVLAGVAVVAIAGVAALALGRGSEKPGKTGIEAAAVTPDSAAVATLPAAPAPTAPAAVTPPVAPPPADTVPAAGTAVPDSAARAKLVADSVKAAKQDSIRLAKKARDDSLKAAAAAAAAAVKSPREVAMGCLRALKGPDVATIEQLFGGSSGQILRFARDGSLELVQQINPAQAPETVDGPRQNFRMGAVLRAGAGGQAARADIRAAVEVRGTEVKLVRCVVDSDGGIH